MFTDAVALSKLSTLIQVLAIVLIFIGGGLQVVKLCLDKHINAVKEESERKKDANYKSKIANLDNASEFYELSVAVRSDSREALNRVIAIAENPNDVRQALAYNLLADLPKEVEHLNLLEYQVDWQKEGIDPAKATLGDFSKVYFRNPPIFQTKIMETLWKSELVTKKDKLLFLINVLQTTPSLRCLNFACQLLNEESKMGKNLLGWQEYKKWWDTKSSAY